jgi:hypothetical protein
VTTLVAVAIVWRYLYHPRYWTPELRCSEGSGSRPIDWLGDPHFAMPAIILLSVWKNFGYNMMIFIAGLQGIPEEQYEAARIDGAGAWQCFWRVTLPNLAPTFLFVGVLTMIGFFQLFAEPYVMTQGGPLKSTTTIVLMMYEEGFRWWRLGMVARDRVRSVRDHADRHAASDAAPAGDDMKRPLSAFLLNFALVMIAVLTLHRCSGWWRRRSCRPARRTSSRRASGRAGRRSSTTSRCSHGSSSRATC